MLLADFKLSTAGMPVDRLLAARVDDNIVPLRLVGIDANQLVLELMSTGKSRWRMSLL